MLPACERADRRLTHGVHDSISMPVLLVGLVFGVPFRVERTAQGGHTRRREKCKASSIDFDPYSPLVVVGVVCGGE